MMLERDMVEEAMRAADIDKDSLYEGYSGRAIYGAKCFGITGSMEDYSKFLVQLTQLDTDIAWDLAQNVRTDSMGYDSIFYFPGYQLDNGGEEDE